MYRPKWLKVTPESPRWLLSQGRVKEAEAIVRKAAEMNKVKAPLVEENKIEKNNKRFTQSLAYYGLSLNTSKLSADPFVACFISAAVEVPAYISAWIALKLWPRRPTLFSFMLLGGLSLLTIQAVPQSLPALAVALEMLGKFFIAANACLAFPCTAEIFPTSIRNTATGTCSTISRVGTSLAPFVFQLTESRQKLSLLGLALDGRL
ncbi:hypothetical protein WMY93_007433 [Mugilogobius chulae]|uniref:Uncharacterized protein n=1 Tax=Mugilogobius chulae TaxID=88201 RepID=A0AAW0PLZ9_9GOBI